MLNLNRLSCSLECAIQRESELHYQSAQLQVVELVLIGHHICINGHASIFGIHTHDECFQCVACNSCCLSHIPCKDRQDGPCACILTKSQILNVCWQQLIGRHIYDVVHSGLTCEGPAGTSRFIWLLAAFTVFYVLNGICIQTITITCLLQ